MRFFTTALALMPLAALAVPTNWEHKEENKEHKEVESKHDDYKQDDWKHEDDKVYLKGPFHFTSTYKAWATPDTIINNNQTAVPGLPGGYGTFEFGINAPEELICWNITVYISGNYSSPAKTATHIHEAAFGRSGPPRLAFTNPTSDSPLDEFGRRTSYGCMTGPFTTGVAPNGTDTATGFSLAQIEANPPAFFADTHTAEYVAGAIRGQLELTGSAY